MILACIRPGKVGGLGHPSFSSPSGMNLWVKSLWSLLTLLVDRSGLLWPPPINTINCIGLSHEGTDNICHILYINKQCSLNYNFAHAPEEGQYRQLKCPVTIVCYCISIRIFIFTPKGFLKPANFHLAMKSHSVAVYRDTSLLLAAIDWTALLFGLSLDPPSYYLES